MSTRRSFMKSVAAAASSVVASFYVPDTVLAAMSHQSGRVIEDQPLLPKVLEQLQAKLVQPIADMTPQQIEVAARGCNIDLFKFALEPDSNSWWDLKRPVEQKGWTYACDGRIIIRTDIGFGADYEDERGKIPDMTGGLPWYHLPKDGWKRWPKTAYDFPTGDRHSDDRGPCPYCKGRGVVGDDVEACDECEDGEVWVSYCDNADDYRFYDKHTATVLEHDSCSGRYQICRNCDGSQWTGKKQCKSCNGRGTSGHCRVIGDHVYACHYNDLIAELDEPEYFDINHLQPRQWKDYQPILFRCNGGQGMLMPFGR